MPTITINFIAASAVPARPAATFSSKTGQSLMEAAVHENLQGIAADCGGLMTCATCHVYVDEAWAAKLPPPSSDELGMLEFTAAPRRPTSRLACQIELTPELDGLTVELPPTQY